jgi:hypothetical protein
MCGRYTSTAAFDELALRFGITIESGTNEELTARYNVAPTQMVPIIRAGDKGRRLIMANWGFRPAWVKSRHARADQRPCRVSRDSSALQRGCQGRTLPHSGDRILWMEARARSEAQTTVLCSAQGRGSLRVRGTLDTAHSRGCTAHLRHHHDYGK